MDQVSTILSVAAVVGGLGTISAAIFFIYKIARRIDDAIGIDDQGRTLSDRLGRVEHQLWPNGGSSLADQVHKIDQSMTKTSAEVEIIKNFIIGGTVKVETVHVEAEPTKTTTIRRRKVS